MSESDRIFGAAEATRLESLAPYNILDTLPEQEYEDVTKLAAFICGTPISLVSLVAEDRQWFKSEFGMGARETARNLSFCAHTIHSKQTLIVADAQADPRFRDNALVTGDPHIRFYAGAPIIEPGGNVLGTVCVIDREPRDLSAGQIEALEGLARQTMALLHQHHLAEVLKTQFGAVEAEAEARKKVEGQLQAFTRATNDALYQMSADWSVMYQLTGKNFPEDIQGPNPDWLNMSIHPLDQHDVKKAIQHAIDTKSQFNFEHRVLRSDGTLGWTASRAVPTLDSAGEISSWLGTARDITSRKLTEAILVRSEKLAAVGRLASTIAHEINNPLEAVTNLLYLARENAINPQVRDWLAQADAELRRVSVITSQTLRFHRQSTKPMPVTCTNLFSSTLDLYEARLRNNNISVEKRKRAEAPVLCFEGDIRQILSNFVANAVDAMPNGGRLLVRSREGTDWQTGRKGVVLTVADSGKGMDAETLAHAMEAFYTTKGVGGSGLGLWISAQIMERHKGRMLLRSSQAQGCHGTVVSVFIPYGEDY